MNKAPTLPARIVTRSAESTLPTDKAAPEGAPYILLLVALVGAAAELDVPIPGPLAVDALPGLTAFCLYCASWVSLAALTANTWNQTSELRARTT